MNLEKLLGVAASLVTPIVPLFGFLSRNRRLRSGIKDNMLLLKEIEGHPSLVSRPKVSEWIQDRIVIDVAKLTGQYGPKKRPLPLGTLFVTGILATGFGYLTYRTWNFYTWWSVGPGTVTLLFVLAAYGMTINRELPPPDEPPATV